MGVQELHTVVPAYILPDTHRRPVSLWRYKQEKPIVLVLCNRYCEPLLRSFAACYPVYRDWGAEIFAIKSESPGEFELRFPVLIDRSGDTLARLAESLPAVLLLDSYCELEERWQGPWPDGPNHDRILRALSVVQMRCPECGAPEWPRNTSD